MNKKELTINDLGLALRELGYSPVVSSLESFSVHKDGFNYEVCAGALPTVYLEGSFPFDWFDTDKLYQNRLIAMNMVNAQRDDVNPFHRNLQHVMNAFRDVFRRNDDPRGTPRGGWQQHTYMPAIQRRAKLRTLQRDDVMNVQHIWAWTAQRCRIGEGVEHIRPKLFQ